MKFALTLVALALSAPAAAQDLVFSMDATDACFASGGTSEDCIGASAEACTENTPGGYTTVGMGGCYDAERQAWDQQLNQAYAEAMAYAKQMDAENADFAPSQVDALREMQRAWIPYRDRSCDYIRSQWGGGTGGGPASIMCLMQETARQALFLESTMPGD